MPLLTPRRSACVCRIFAFAFVAVLFFCARDLRAEEISKEYQIKAVFLFNFSHFVDWPTNSFTNAQSPFVIGVLGDDPFGKYLDDTVRGEKIGTHPLVIQRFQWANQAKDCQILFVSQSEAKKLPAIIKEFAGTSILTVGDAKNFSENGGMIGFFNTTQNKVHFQINLEAAKSAGLTISSKLLRLADTVETAKGGAQ